MDERQNDENTITTTAKNNGADHNSSVAATMNRKEKRKAMKKMKRKQLRKEMAMKQREEEEAKLNDPEEQMRLLRLEQEEAERMARERLDFEERERQFLQALEREKKRQEEEEGKQRKLLEEAASQSKLDKNENANEENEDDGWEYIEEGPAEIIWKGNEIIVKKKKVRVCKKVPDIPNEKQESGRPISNPLAPQCEAFEDYKSAQEALESVAQQVPNFGTEQDKEHCPFHLKTGVCRFGARCSRVHFYPDKACTILIKNMYNGPGPAWEQDEGLEHTDEEVKRSFEDFYEDVHTEFLKFGELVNFKVCKNGSSHLRGNVYVHYKSLESAMLAYQSTNGRYFAGKLLTCEFVNVMRWRVAICGEYMKSRLKTCSRGSACNFIHCFHNPGGDYEWADWDKPAPRYWLKKMTALFGYTDNRLTDEASPRYHSRRSRSRGLDSPHRRSFSDEDDAHRRRRDRQSLPSGDSKHRETDNVDVSVGSTDGQRSVTGTKRRSKKRVREQESTRQDNKSRKVEAISAKDDSAEGGASDRYLEHKSRSFSRQKRVAESVHECRNKKVDKHDQEKSLYADMHDKFLSDYRYKDDQHVTHKKNEAVFVNFASHGEDSEEDRHHSCSKENSRRMKDESELSSSASDESRLALVKKRQQKEKRKSSSLKNKTSAAEVGCGSLVNNIGREHRYCEKSPRGRKNISESADGRGNRDDKSPRKNVRKSSRLKNHSGFTDTESDKDEDRHYIHGKHHSRHVKNDVESSDSAFDGDRLGRYERRSRKSRRVSSWSKKESNIADNGDRIDEEESYHEYRSGKQAKHCIKESNLSKVDSNATRHSGEADAGNFVTDDSSYGDLTSERDHKKLDENHMLQINRSNEKATASGQVETCLAHTGYEGFEEEAELEKVCRHAALKKLEEIRMLKDNQAAPSRDSRQPIERLRVITHENILSRVQEKSGSSKVETSDASIKRRRV